jgi:hypothetical protein
MAQPARQGEEYLQHSPLDRCDERDPSGAQPGKARYQCQSQGVHRLAPRYGLPQPGQRDHSHYRQCYQEEPPDQCHRGKENANGDQDNQDKPTLPGGLVRGFGF